MVVALLVRGGVAFARLSSLDADPDSYRQLAENLSNHRTFGLPARAPLGDVSRASLANAAQASSDLDSASIVPTAYRPPLYPLLLAGLVREGRLSLPAVAVVQTLLGVATIGLAVHLAEQWGLGRAKWLVALFVLVDPLLVNQATLVMTETLAAFLLVAGLWSSERLRAAPSTSTACVAGIIWGLAALCRPTFLPVAPLVAALSLAWSVSRETWPRRGLRATVLVLSTLAIVAPWMVRNWRWSGQWIGSTTHGGYTLLLGNNPLFYRHLRDDQTGLPWDAAELQNLDAVRAAIRFPAPTDPLPIAVERETDQRLGQMAWATMREEPGMAAFAAAYRVGQLWSPWPHRTEAHESRSRRWLRGAIALWYLALSLAALRGLVAIARSRLSLSPWTLGLAICLLFTVVHSLYWSNLRMRTPLMPFVALVAAAGWRSLRSRDS